LAICASAQAHDVGTLGGDLSETQLRAEETMLLGPEHAAEHAAERAAEAREKRRLSRFSPREQRQLARQKQRKAEEFAVQTEGTGTASEVGRWTQAPFQIPHVAINAAMLPTGKVMFWGKSFPNEPINRGNAALWDPSKGTGSDAFTEVPPPAIDPDGSGPQRIDTAPLFCSGQSLLPSGEVLITGGNRVFPDQFASDQYIFFAGLNRAFTFNPWTETWTEQPQMNHGRWYPGQVELPGGRTLILSGYTGEPPGGVINRDLEMFTPAAQPGGVGSMTLVPSAERNTALYPHLFTLPNSNVLLAGPGEGDSAVLRTTDYTWHNLPRPSQARTGGNAVLDPGPPSGSWRVTQVGGFPNWQTAKGTHPATPTTETMNAKYAGMGWRRGAPLNLSRSYGNTVLLPDRSMVMVGGGVGYTIINEKHAIDGTGQRRQVELYDPATDTWRLGPAQVEDRGYHSTALLLPNGKVWSAGDDKYPLEPDGGWELTDTAEIYSPPYLFKGPRPKILSTPTDLRWGDVFSVSLDPTVPVDSAVLVAPGTTTHGADSNQRVVKLAVRHIQGDQIELVAPPKAAVAPPGYYMLFVLHQGVPSIAKWVKLSPNAPNQPP
jgi:galactose oxidase-like protein